MAQIQRQHQSHTFAQDDPDDSLSLELELQKLRSIQRNAPTSAATNGHGLYSDRNRSNGKMGMANDLYRSVNGTAAADSQEHARKMRNQMILAKIQEIERNFTSVGLERQRKLEIMRREHEALIRKYRPMQLLYKHVGISSSYSDATASKARQPELRSTGVNTVISGPVKPSASDRVLQASKSLDLESKHSSIGRRITFTDDGRNDGSIDNINLDEYQSNININPNNNNIDDWTNENTANNRPQTLTTQDQLGQIVEPTATSSSVRHAENEIKRNQNNRAEKLVEDDDNELTKANKTSHQLKFLDLSTTESEDNASAFPRNNPGLTLSDDETSEITPLSNFRKSSGIKAAAVNLSSDSSFTTFPSTHNDTDTSLDILARGKKEDNDEGETGVAGASSLEILDGPGTETMDNAGDAEDVAGDPYEEIEDRVRIRRHAPGIDADDNEDDNTETSAAGESIVMDSIQNIKTPDSLPRDESELVHITEADGEDEVAEEEQQQEVKNRTKVINEDQNKRVKDAADDWMLESIADEENKEEEVHTIFTKGLLPLTTSASDMDADAQKSNQDGDRAAAERRMDEEMNPNRVNERNFSEFDLASMDPTNLLRSDKTKHEINEEVDDEENREPNKLINDDSWNDSDSEDKNKEKADKEKDEDVLFPRVPASVAAESKTKRAKIKVNYDSEESEFSEPAAKLRPDDKEQETAKKEAEAEEDGTKDVRSPYAPYSNPVTGPTSDTTNLITESELAKMVETDFDDFFD